MSKDKIPVLDFRVRGSEPWQKREDILIPVWVYGIVAPVKKQNQLNFIEVAILSFCRINQNLHNEIAAQLDLHPELVKTILNKLQGERLLDSTWQITNEGRSYLSSGELDQVELATGFVIENGLSGELYPYFFNSLPYQDKPSSKGLTSTKEAHSWSELEIQKFITKRVSQNKKSNSQNEFRLMRPQSIQTPWSISKPEQMYLRTFLYVTQENEQSSDFRAVEPIVGEDSPQLKATLWNQRFVAPLDEIFQKLFKTDGAGFEKIQAYQRELEQRAFLALESSFGQDVNSSVLLQNLVEIWSKRLEIEDDRNSGWKIARVRDLCSRTRVAIEAAIKDARSQFSARASNIITIDPDAHFEATIKRLGGDETDIPSRFKDLKPQKKYTSDSIWHNADSIKGGKKNDAVAAMLIEADVAGHGFIHQGFTKFPNLLRVFHMVFSTLDQNAHDSNQPNPLSGFDELEQFNKNCDIVLSVLLRLELRNEVNYGKK